MKRILVITILALLTAQAEAAYRFGPVLSIPTGSNPRGLLARDLDGDGKAELVVANFGSPTLIGAVTVEAAGTLQIFTAAPGSLALKQTIPSGKSPRSVEAADVNADGRLDLLVSHYDEDTLGVYLQDSAGAFGLSQSLGTGAHPVGIAAKDLGSGLLVAVANYNGNSLSVFLANSAGLNLVSTVVVGANPTDAEIFVQGSGEALLLSANFGANSLSVLPLDPGGTVGTKVDWPLAGNPCKFAPGDVGQDKSSDLSVALFTANQVAIFEQKQGRLEGTASSVTLTGQHPNGLAALDLGGSRGLRLVSANRDTDTLDIIARGHGGSYGVLQTLTVLAGVETPAMFGPVEVAAADFNGDGRGDLAATHMRSASLRVFLQEAPGALKLASSSHPEPSKWYPATTAVFEWEAPDASDVDHYLTAFDQVALTQPDQTTSATSASYPGLAAGIYYFHVRAVTQDGEAGEVQHLKIGVSAEMSKANVYNYPNPSRDGHTTIRFPLNERAAVQIRIFDADDQLVWSRDLGQGETIAGVNNVEWDGRNGLGQAVGNGGYLLQVISGDKTITKKIAIVR